MTRVVVAEDEALVRDGLVAIVSSHPDIEVVGTAADGEQAVSMTSRLRPDVVLMDLRMPVLDGIEATRRIVAATDARVLVLTTVQTDETVAAALEAGAGGFLLKSSTREQLWVGVQAVASGEALLDPVLTRRLIERHLRAPRDRPARPIQVTGRQADVVRLVAQGLSNAEISAELHLAESTVKGYVSEVLARHGLRDRTQLVVLAYESGLVTPGSG
jgi:DNA-binding NarL/FixJ family response regulator